MPDLPLSRQALRWLVLASLVLVLTGLGLRDPWPADEPRFAQVAMEMVQSGQWFFPTRGGELYPDKPPLFMWSIAVFYALLGSIKLAFLLPSALSALLTLYLVYDLGRRLWDEQTGILAAALLLLSLQFLLQAKTAQIDAMVCAWITLGCYGLLRGWLLGGHWRWIAVAGLAMGLGVITKGVGFLPLLMLLPYLAARHWAPSQQEQAPVWRWVWAPMIMLAVIALWLVPMLLMVWGSDDPSLQMYRDNILFKQTARRYADSWHHIKPFWYYLTSVIPLFWLPLSLLLPWLIPHWWRAVRSGDRRIVLPLGWILLVLLFFSLSPGKRGVYILPALPMLALISAPYLQIILKGRWSNRLVWAVVTLLGLLLAGAGLAGLYGIEATRQLEASYDIYPWPFLLVTGLLGLLSSWLTLDHKALSWMLFVPALWLLYSTWGYLLLAPAKTPRHVFQTMMLHVPVNTELAIVGMKEQFLLFSPYNITHFGYHTPEQDQQRLAWHWLKSHPNGRVLMAGSEEIQCFNPDKAWDLGFAHRQNWLLMDSQTALPDCQPASVTIPEYRLEKIPTG